MKSWVSLYCTKLLATRLAVRFLRYEHAWQVMRV